MSEWRDISTAPRDTDEYVLLAWRMGLGIALARWVPELGAWMTQDGYEMPGDHRFTHWMPLPEPPHTEEPS